VLFPVNVRITNKKLLKITPNTVSLHYYFECDSDLTNSTVYTNKSNDLDYVHEKRIAFDEYNELLFVYFHLPIINVYKAEYFQSVLGNLDGILKSTLVTLKEFLKRDPKIVKTIYVVDCDNDRKLIYLDSLKNYEIKFISVND
jgi:hypothetical protein